MSKRQQPDSNSAEIAAWKQQAAHAGDPGADDSDEVNIWREKRSR